MGLTDWLVFCLLSSPVFPLCDHPVQGSHATHISNPFQIGQINYFSNFLTTRLFRQFRPFGYCIAMAFHATFDVVFPVNREWLISNSIFDPFRFDHRNVRRNAKLSENV